MQCGEPKREPEQACQQILGYLNFSSGASDPNFLANLNRIWAPSELGEAAVDDPMWERVVEHLRRELTALQESSPAFREAGQAAIVLQLVDQVIPAYRRFHRDLLFDWSDQRLVNAFFFGRVCEVVLQQGPPWDEAERICQGAIQQLNDYLGYRPVAVLQSRKIEPYAHERVRPVPLFVQGAGVARGPYEAVIELALQLLQETDRDLLQAAYFDPDLLDELAFDPRPYDFDHPVNKRPNYHFGQWDPHLIDNPGRYRRFVVQQVTLDALMQRLEEGGELPCDELLFEAAAVLAGTILMASGVSGSGPDAHDSMTTLSTLLPRIARYRDEFYARLIDRTDPRHAERLRREAVEKRQPFGDARQQLNAQLARRRASQLEHVQLAKLFARMGYPEAAAEQAQVVPTASVRMLCQIDCRLTETHLAIESHDLDRAATLLGEIVQLLHAGIECGAIVDPWNILGFDAQFSLFPSLENSVHDHRIDELIELIEQIFGMYSRAWSEAAARDDAELCERLSGAFRELSQWWRQFAAHQVSNVDAIDAAEAYHAAEHVAQALNLWHKGGAATGDIGFWAPHAEMFDSPKAYALVIQALLEQQDYVASRGLLIHWLSEAERIPLEQGDSSFHRLAERWLIEMRRAHERAGPDAEEQAAGLTSEGWKRIQKFFDYMEANAEDYGMVPQFGLGSARNSAVKDADPFDSPPQESEEEDNPFGAAYEDMVFRDSTDDGIEGEVFDAGGTTEDELLDESQRLCQRLAFLNTLARLWRVVALSPLESGQSAAGGDDAAPVQTERAAGMQRWARQAERNRRQLIELLEVVQAYPIPRPMQNHESMVEYDRRRIVKESLLERIITTCVETSDAARLLAAAELAEWKDEELEGDRTEEEQLAVRAFAALFARDPHTLRDLIDDLILSLADQPLLYVPLAKGGDPQQIVLVRIRQRCIQELLKCLPRMGLIVETCRLIEAARDMERNNPVGSGAVTEFDELYKTGFKSLVECVVASSQGWQDEGDPLDPFHSPLVNCLEQLTEAMLISWLSHSQTLRLSVLEKVNEERAWNRLVSFIERYGAELFTQRFLNMGNIRAVLHQGVDSWLQSLIEDESGQIELRLLDELDREVSRREAVSLLTLVLEAVVENYGEYRDYNSTTTQSDRGELLYCLLDFLRLRARYDRVCWNLKPVVMAHQILVRRGRKQAAQLWRRALRERIAEEADKFHEKLVALQKKYAMQMPSIADRLAERFVRPMIIDRICALVEPAVREAGQEGANPSFRILRYEIEFLTQEPAGVGFDVPVWLMALEDEAQRTRLPDYERDDYDELDARVPAAQLTSEEIEAQLTEWLGQ